MSWCGSTPTSHVLGNARHRGWASGAPQASRCTWYAHSYFCVDKRVHFAQTWWNIALGSRRKMQVAPCPIGFATVLSRLQHNWRRAPIHPSQTQENQTTAVPTVAYLQPPPTSRSTASAVHLEPEMSPGLVLRLMRKTVPWYPRPDVSPSPIISPRPPGRAKKGAYWFVSILIRSWEQ